MLALLYCGLVIFVPSKTDASDNIRKENRNHSSITVRESNHTKNSGKPIQPNVTVETLSANQQCYSGNNFSFTSNSTISSGSIATEFWDFGDGKTASGTSVSHSYFLPGTYQVKLIVTSDKGCVDSMSHSVTVYPQPQASFIIPAGQCLTGNNFNFISNATIGLGGSISSQTWNFGDGNLASGSSTSHSFAIDGKYPVNLQVTSNNGCTDIITDTITVFQMPAISVSNVSSICSGSSLNINSVASGGAAPYQYLWTGPNGFSSSSASPTITNISINATGNYSVALNDSNGCTASASTSLLVNLTPIVPSINGPLGGCVGSSINLTDAIAGGIWSSRNTNIATVNASSGQVNFLSIGSVTIDYTVTNTTCTTTVSTNLFSNSVTLHPDIIECNNGVTHFNATDTYYGVTYSNNNAGNTYLWTITGGPFSYQGSSSATTKFTDLQLQTGNSFTIKIQFTSNAVSCTAQQMVYKNTTSADSILGSHDTTVCNTAVAIPLSGVVSAASNSFQWTSSGTGTFSNSTALNTTYTPSAADKLAGVLKIYFTATSNLNSTGNCGSAYGKDSMILRIYPANMSTNSNQIICSNQNINFSPVSSITGSFYSWSSSVVAGSVNGNSATGTGNINDSLVNTSNALDAQVVYNITPFAFTPTNITCIGNPFNYTVLIKPKPKSTITNNASSICTGSTSNIQFNSTLLNTVYTWTSMAINGAVNGNSSNTVPSTNNLIQDILTNALNVNSTVRYFIQSVSTSGCTSNDSTDVLIYAMPTNANAGPDQILCNVSSSILSANIPGIGIGKWEMLSGPSAVVFGTPSSPFSTVTGLVTGNYQLIWSITNGSCTVSKDTIQLINSPTSIGGSISSNATVCSGQNSGTVILSGYTGTIKGWESSIDGGLTWPIAINNTTDTYNFNNLITTTLFRAIIQSGNCSAVYSSPVTITVNSITNAGILISDTSVCISSNSGTLILNNNNGSILRWESSIDAGSSWQTINNSSNSFSFTNLSSTTLYRVLVQNGTCSIAYSNTISVKVNPLSNAGTLAASTIVCSNNNNGLLTLSGNTGKIIAWETSTNNGSTWNIIIDSSNSISYNNLTTTTIYRATIQSGNCLAVYSNINTITVLQAATIANAGTDQALCNQTSTTLAANSPTSGTGSWSALVANPSTISFTNPVDPHTTVTGLVAGTYQFVWTISNAICADSKDTVQVIVYPPTIAGLLSADAIVCANNNTNTLAITGSTGAILAWESSTNNGSSWNTVANNNSSYTYANLNASTSYRAIVQNQICPAAYSNIVNITVLQAVSIANAGTDQALCNETSTTLAANTPTSGTGSWSALVANPTTVSFTNPVDPHTTVTGLVAGTYQFVWTISNTLCADSKDTVQIVVLPTTNPGILSADATVCANSNNGALSLNGYMNTIQHWESSVNGTSWNTIANTNNTLNYTNLITSMYYRVSVINGNCPSLFSNTIRITVLPAPTIADAGPDTTLINGFSSYKLSGNIPSSGTGVWSIIPPIGPSNLVFTDTSDPKATIRLLTFHYADSTTIPITPASDGVYYLKWTISNGVCPASESVMVVTVQPPTNPGFAGPDTVVCAGTNNGSIKLTGYYGEILQWEDSTTNASGWQIIPRTIGKDQDTIHFENLATTTMYRALVKNGVGLSLYSGIAATITVLDPVTTADAGIDSSICNTSSIQLWGNIPSIGTGTWSYLPNGSGTSTPSFSNKKDANAIVTGLSNGTYQFVWTISNGICNNSTDTVKITIEAPTEAGTIFASNVVCANNNYGILHLIGYKGSVIQGTYSTDDGINWLPLLNSAYKDSIIYTNLSVSTKFRVEVKNGVCPALFSNIVNVIVLLNVSIANAGTDQALCNQTSTTLAANMPTSGTGSWSALTANPSAVNFSNIADPNSTITGLIAGTYQFVWTISNSLCTDSKDTVQIIVHPPTITGLLSADAVVCANNNTNTLTLTGTTGNILAWESSTNNGSSWNTIANNNSSYTYNNLNTSTSYRALVQNKICTSVYSNIVNITVLQAATIANAGIDQALCNQTTTTLAANAPTSGTGKWTVLPSNPSSVNFSNAVDPNSTVSGLLAGTYQFVWTITNTLCADSKDTVQIIVHPPTIAGLLSADAVVCANNNTNTLALTGSTGSINVWESSINGGSSWITIVNNNSTYTYNNLNTSTSYRALVQNKICPSAYSNIVNITVLQAATIANAGLDQAICNQTSITLAANAPTSGTGKWTALISNPSTVNFSNISDQSSTVSGLLAGTYQFVWTITNTLCVDSKDTVQIIVYAEAKAGSLTSDNFICADTNSGNLTLSNYTGNVAQWESTIDNGVNWNIIPSTNNTYNYSNITKTTQFRVLVTNGLCNSVYSNLVTITVNPVTQPGILSSTNRIVCASYNNGTLSLTGYTGTIIHWEYSKDNGVNWTIINQSNNSYEFNNISTATLYRVLVQSGVCSSAYSNTILVSTSSATSAGTISGNATVCYNNNSGSLFLSGNSGNILHWESSIDNGNSWSIIADTSSVLTYNLLTNSTIYRALIQNGVCSIEYTNSVKIDIVQPVTIANAGPNQVICNSNTTALLQANIASSGEGVWSMISGNENIYFDDATSANTKVNGLLPGTYQFNWKIENGICAASESTVTIIVDKLKADFGLSAINDCGSTTYQFVDASTALFGIANWKWSSAQGDSTTNVKNFSKTYTQPGQNKVSLTVESNVGCSITTGANYQVKIFFVPKANINAINEACKNQLLQLSSTLSSRDSINAIIWNLGNGINTKDSAITVQYYSEGKYTIKLLVSTVNKCYDSTLKDIAIHPLPIVLIPTEQIACKGDTIKLTATGALKYIWKDQQNTIVCNGCDTYSFLPSASSNISIIGYNQYGCSQIANTNVKLIQPIKIVTSLLDTLCQGASIKLKVTGADTYSWLPDLGLSNYKIANPVATPQITTTYTVIGKENYACFTDTAKIKLVVGTPTAIKIGTDTTIQSGVPFKLMANSNELQNIRRWQWSGNANFSCVNCQTTIAKVVYDAMLNCIATNIFGCASIDTISIKTFCPNSEIFIPNAFTPDGDGINDILFVQGSGIKLIKSFKIYSRWGELVFERINFQPGDPSNGWDGKVRGKPATQDVFVYICEAVCEKGIPATFKGNIALLK